MLKSIRPGLKKSLKAAALTCLASQLTAVNKTYVTLQDVKSMCTELYTQIKNDNYQPDLLIGLSRGGLTPLSFLAGEKSFNNRNTRTINVQSYSDQHHRGALNLTTPINAEDLQNFKTILVIDDLADSGATLDFVMTTLKEIFKDRPDVCIKSAVLFYKKHSKIMPDYYVAETADWIVFPWEE